MFLGNKLDSKNFKKTMQSIDKSKVLLIFSNRNLQSVCSVFVFSQILKKELFKYQIDFKNMESSINFYFESNNALYGLLNENSSSEKFELTGILSLYSIVKNLNFLKVETLWPITVCYSYFNNFENDYNDMNDFKSETFKNANSNNVSENIYNNISNNKTDINTNNNINTTNKTNSTNNINNDDIVCSVKTLNSKNDGIFFHKKINLLFLNSSSLFSSINSNLALIFQKNLFYLKSDRKIAEFLAKRGISISSANESFLNLDSLTKSLCISTFGESDTFLYKLGHDIEVSSTEYAFLILFYLYKEKDMYSFMCLDKRKLIDLEKASKFYQKIIVLFKEAAINARKTENTILFTIKSTDLSVNQILILANILDSIFISYLRYRNELKYLIIQNYSVENNKNILFSKNVNFENNNFVPFEKIGENIIKIETKDLSTFIKNIQ